MQDLYIGMTWMLGVCNSVHGGNLSYALLVHISIWQFPVGLIPAYQSKMKPQPSNLGNLPHRKEKLSRRGHRVLGIKRSILTSRWHFRTRRHRSNEQQKAWPSVTKHIVSRMNTQRRTVSLDSGSQEKSVTTTESEQAIIGKLQSEHDCPPLHSTHTRCAWKILNQIKSKFRSFEKYVEIDAPTWIRDWEITRTNGSNAPQRISLHIAVQQSKQAPSLLDTPTKSLLPHSTPQLWPRRKLNCWTVEKVQVQLFSTGAVCEYTNRVDRDIKLEILRFHSKTFAPLQTQVLLKALHTTSCPSCLKNKLCKLLPSQATSTAWFLIYGNDANNADEVRIVTLS